MHCPKCGAEIGQYSLLCPRCHERVPERSLDRIEKHILHQAPSDDQKNSTAAGGHHWPHIMMSILIVVAVGLAVVRVGRNAISDFKNSADQVTQDSREHMQEVCRQGFSMMAISGKAAQGGSDSLLDQYVKEQGFTSQEMFLAACSPFTGEFVNEIFHPKI